MSRLFEYVSSSAEHAAEIRSFLNSTAPHHIPLTQQHLNASMVFRVSASALPPPESMLATSDGTMPPMAQMPANSVEETESLFVPLFRKGRFVLGDLHGEISPNGLGLRMVTSTMHGTSPVQIARRFCVDLSICDAIEFLEYEWFSDGNVIVTMHSVDLDGDYSGISIVLDCSENDEMAAPRATSADEGSPLKVVLRANYTETVDCDSCLSSRASCSCPQSQAKLVDLAPNGLDDCLDWVSWMSAFVSTRTCVSTTTVSLRAVTAMGELPVVMSFRLQQTAEMGEESGLALIRRRYEKLRASQSPPVCEEAVVEEASAVEDKVYESIVSPEDLPDFMSSVGSSFHGESHVGLNTMQSPSVLSSSGPGTDAHSEAPPAIPSSRMPGRRALGGGVRKKVFNCECGAVFSHKGHLNIHKLSHKNLRPHPCTSRDCTAKFAKRSDLRRHAKTVHSMSFLSDDEDPAEAASSKPFPCPHCDKRYVTRQGARKHLSSKHPEATLRKASID